MLSCQEASARSSADKLHAKAAQILPLVGLARSKKHPINRGHGARYLYRPTRPMLASARTCCPNLSRGANNDENNLLQLRGEFSLAKSLVQRSTSCASKGGTCIHLRWVLPRWNAMLCQHPSQRRASMTSKWSGGAVLMILSIKTCCSKVWKCHWCTEVSLGRLQGSSILQAAPAVHTGPGRLNGSSISGAAALHLGPDSSAAQNGTTPADSSAAGASTDGFAAKRCAA